MVRRPPILPARRQCLVAVLTVSSLAALAGCLRPAPEAPLDRILAAPRANPADYEVQAWTVDGVLQRIPGTSAFDTADGHITCHWGQSPPPEDRVVCEIDHRATTPPPVPPDCDVANLTWATAYVSLGAEGARDGLCTGGIQVPYRGAVLPDGTALLAGSFGCLPENRRVICVHSETGRGFAVSESELSTF